MTTRSEVARQYSQFGLWTEERIGLLMTSAARRWPEQELIYIDGRRYTYNDIWRWTIAVAHGLVQRGVGPGDRVLLHLGNCIELVVTQLAVWRIGAVSVPVIPIYREHEMRHILADSKPRAIVAMKAFGDRSPIREFEAMFADNIANPRIRMVVGATEPIEGWQKPLPCPEASAEITESGLPEPAPADSVSLVLYTSGTTSAPKGAMLTGRALLSNAESWRHVLALSAQDVAFSGAPLAHIAAMCSAFLAPVRTGSRTVIMTAWNGERAAELIVKEGATYMAGAMVFLQDLVEQFEKGVLPKPTLAYISGGAATPASLIERADKVGISAQRSWGMTETAGTCTLVPRDAPLHLRSQFDGQVEFGTEVKIVDDDNRPVPFGQLGNALVRTPQLMVSYTDPVATAAQLDEEGWFRTGDMGTLDADGWFLMNGRSKDIINRGGEKFSSMDIEMALASHPDIVRAAVVGAPHPRFGEEVAACIVLRQGVVWSGPETVIRHLQQKQLAKQKTPVRWLVLEVLPMTATGKIQKQKLLELLLENERQSASAELRA